MGAVDIDVEFKKIFLGIACCLGGLLLVLLGRCLRVFVFGRRYRGRVVKVLYPEAHGRHHFVYVVRFTAPNGRDCLVHDNGGLPLKEFASGDAVIVFVDRASPPRAEILSALRVFAAVLSLLVVGTALLATWRHLFGA